MGQFRMHIQNSWFIGSDQPLWTLCPPFGRGQRYSCAFIIMIDSNSLYVIMTCSVIRLTAIWNNVFNEANYRVKWSFWQSSNCAVDGFVALSQWPPYEERKWRGPLIFGKKKVNMQEIKNSTGVAPGQCWSRNTSQRRETDQRNPIRLLRTTTSKWPN